MKWTNLRVSSSAVIIATAVYLVLPGFSRSLAAEGTTSSSKPNLTGVVQGENGKPLSGATVFIYTAGPKEGVATLCPSCYADCRKRATTDARGQFRIEALDPTLLFRILVVNQGCRPEFVSKIDPALKPIEVVLKPGREGIEPERQLKGRVSDPKGKPIAGAVVSIRGVRRQETTRFGGNEDTDQVAVSDEQGQFVINSEKRFDAAGVEVEAAGFAKGIFNDLVAGSEVHELKLTEGGSVTGSLVKQNKPLPGVEMGVCGANREASVYVGDFLIGTDEKGEFRFINLPPDRDYFVYARMESLGARGAVPAQRIRINEDGSTTELGNIQVVNGFKLTGQIKLTDGKAVPPKTRVQLSREEAWDASQIEADEQGRFSFIGVPSESVSLTTRVKGYRYSLNNRSLNPANPFRLEGLLKGDKTDLVMELEPGENAPGNLGSNVDLRHEPLQGAEDMKEHSGDLHVTGTVIDAESKQPLEIFSVTEGHAAPFPETTEWLTGRQRQGKNGKLEVFLIKGNRAPAILVEADGYLPKTSGPITTPETNITFELKKGVGPAGTVMKPNGQPAPGISVYLASMRDGVYVQDKDMKVNSRIYRGTRRTETDEQGRFQFKPMDGDYAVLVLDDAGFAQVTVEELRKQPILALRAWAKVQGKLMIGSQPGTDEEVRLWLAQIPYAYIPRSFPPLGLYLQTTTDNDGQFSFKRVPPLSVQVYHSPRVKEEKMGTTPMSQTTTFTLAPGEVKTVTVGGQGRPVVGQMVVNGYDGKINWRSDAYWIDLIMPTNTEVPDVSAQVREFSGKIQAADSEDEKTRLLAEMQAARGQANAQMHDYYTSERGRDYYFRSSKRYALNFTQDGRFRIEDVPGGNYRLHVDLRQGSGPAVYSTPAIASVQKGIQVPDAPGGRTDEPYDLGKIEMEARVILTAGKSAPDFAIKTVDDAPLKLSDYAGKYVLLDFWAVWCGPCVAETPHLKATYDAFKDDPRFRMIGLSLDPKAATPRDYARKNEINWVMGFLGDWSKDDVTKKYGVEGIPSIFLIGPDGKIIARDLRGPAIKTAVEKALTKVEAARGQ